MSQQETKQEPASAKPLASHRDIDWDDPSSVAQAASQWPTYVGKVQQHLIKSGIVPMTKPKVVRLRIQQRYQPELVVTPEVKQEVEDAHIDEALKQREKGWQRFVREEYQKNFKAMTPAQLRKMGAHDVALVREDNIAREAEKKKQAEESESNAGWYVTVNPCPSVSFAASFQAVEKFLSKQINDEHIFSIENYTDNGQRIHYHILINKKKGEQYHEKTRFTNSARSSFKYICGSLNGHTVNIREVKTEHDREQILAYIYGNKSADKMANVELDRQWREDRGLQQVYTSQGWDAQFKEPEEGIDVSPPRESNFPSLAPRPLPQVPRSEGLGGSPERSDGEGPNT